MDDLNNGSFVNGRRNRMLEENDMMIDLLLKQTCQVTKREESYDGRKQCLLSVLLYSPAKSATEPTSSSSI